jgi:V8-like Glu-specific endopeptidase
MTGTDTSLYQLTTTYAPIKHSYGISALELSAAHPIAGKHIDVVSGYWKTIYACSIDGFVNELHEAGWVWKDSIRYTPECKTIGGTSGSPIVETATGKVVGVNNTGNEDGDRCTLNNPCEVAADGTVTVRHETNYGEQTYLFYGCLKAGSEIDLKRPGCALPKPSAVAIPAA